jgi:hypothetical protein
VVLTLGGPASGHAWPIWSSKCEVINSILPCISKLIFPFYDGTDKIQA